MSKSHPPVPPKKNVSFTGIIWAPFKLYFRLITAPIPYLLYFQLALYDRMPKLKNRKHASLIEPLNIVTNNGIIQGVSITPLSVKTKDLTNRTIIYIPGSFALAFKNCLDKVIPTAEYLKARVILFNNAGCGDSPGKKHTIHEVASSFKQSIQAVITQLNLRKINIWSHSNGSYIHACAIEDIHKNLTKGKSFGVHFFDRTHQSSDLLGPYNLLINIPGMLCISTSIAITCYPLLGLISAVTFQQTVIAGICIGFATSLISRLMPKRIGKNIWKLFTHHTRLNTAEILEEKLKKLKNKYIGYLCSISGGALDEIIRPKAQLNIEAIPHAYLHNTKNKTMHTTHDRPKNKSGNTNSHYLNLHHNAALTDYVDEDGKPVLECIAKGLNRTA